MIRMLSHSEAESVLSCEAKHAFQYTGHLTGGDTLKRKNPFVILREGRAWGAGVARWHQTGELAEAYNAALKSLDDDADKMRDRGVYRTEEHVELRSKILDLLEHYATNAVRLDLEDLEHEVRLPIPSRTGQRPSSRYGLLAYFDGLARDRHGRLWIVEFKLRKSLQSLEHIVLNRQYRWYAWAAERHLGELIAGVVVDERLNEVPKPARWVQGKKKGYALVPSHAKDQVTTPELYLEACAKGGVEPVEETLGMIAARKWQDRHFVPFLRRELYEVNQQLVSVAQLVRDLDSGARYPVRNPQPQRCNSCSFKGICSKPDDDALIDLDFDRTVPKRLRASQEDSDVRPR